MSRPNNSSAHTMHKLTIKPCRSHCEYTRISIYCNEPLSNQSENRSANYIQHDVNDDKNSTVHYHKLFATVQHGYSKKHNNSPP